MDKIITFGLVLSVILAALFACDDKSDIIPIDEPPGFRLIDDSIDDSEITPYLRLTDNSEIPRNVQYIQTEYFDSDEEYPPPVKTTVVSSREELEQYYENNKNLIYDGEGNLKPDDEKFLTAIEKYTDDYFADNFLVIVRVVEGGSYAHRIVRVDETGDIVIKQISVIGPAVMTAWSIVIELDNDSKKDEYRVSIID